MGVQQPSDCASLCTIRSAQTDCDAVGTLRYAPCPPGCIAPLFAHDTGQTAAAFPLRQFHTPLEIHIRAFTTQRPVSGMDDLAPRHPSPPQAPADYAGLDFSAAAAPRPPHQCRAVIARSVGDPFASDDPQPRQRLLRTRAPAEASLLRIDAVVLCIATSAANSRPLPSAATHHPDRCCRVPNRTSPNLTCASTILPRFRAAAVAAFTYSAKIIPKTAEAIRRLGGAVQWHTRGNYSPNPHFAPTFTCYLPENQHAVGLPTD